MSDRDTIRAIVREVLDDRARTSRIRRIGEWVLSAAKNERVRRYAKCIVMLALGAAVGLQLPLF